MEILVGALLIALVVIIYAWYVVLIRRRNRALEALSSIDVLRKRHDLLPNILKLAQRFMTHERDLLSKVVELRNEARQPYDPGSSDAVHRHLAAEGGLQAGLRRLLPLQKIILNCGRARLCWRRSKVSLW